MKRKITRRKFRTQETWKLARHVTVGGIQKFDLASEKVIDVAIHMALFPVAVQNVEPRAVGDRSFANMLKIEQNLLWLTVKVSKTVIK